MKDLTKHLIKYFMVFSVALVVGIFLAKPFFVGFFHDDWSTIVGAAFNGGAFSLERFTWCTHLFLSRPVSGVALYLFSSIGGNSPFVWQLLMSLETIVVIYLFSRLLSCIAFLINKKPSNLEALFFASMFMISPWILGATIFTIATMGSMTASVFFLLSGICFFRYRDAKSMTLFVLSVIFYLLSVLTYEIFYFQFLLWFAIALILTFRRERNRELFLLIAGFVIVQFLAVTWNRVSVALDPISKTYFSDWLSLFLYTAKVFPERLWANFQGIFEVATIAVFGLGFSFATMFIRMWNLKRRDFLSLLLMLTASALLLGISILLYAFAGYGVAASGITSRTMFVPSMLIVTGVFLLSSYRRYLPVDNKAIYGVCLLLLSLAMFGGFFFRFRDWKNSWKIQKEIIASAPIGMITNTDKDAMILFIGPEEYNGVVIFQASWDISGAINYSYPGSFHQFLVGRPGNWETVWDGSQVVQKAKFNDMIVESVKTHDLWVWNYFKNSFIKAEKGVQN